MDEVSGSPAVLGSDGFAHFWFLPLWSLKGILRADAVSHVEALSLSLWSASISVGALFRNLLAVDSRNNPAPLCRVFARQAANWISRTTKNQPHSSQYHHLGEVVVVFFC